MAETKFHQSRLAEDNADLRARLEEAEETLRGIRMGEVDALVVQSVGGPQVYTLQSQDAEANRFRGEMLAQVSDAVIAVDGEERIVYLNAAAELLYGVDAAKILGRTLPCMYESRWPKPENELAARIELSDRGQWRGENIHVGHDGRELHVESSITALCDSAGQFSGRLAVIRDVTERRRSEERLRVSEIRYRRLFEAAYDGVLILDPGTRKIIAANPFMTQMLDCLESQVIGKQLFEVGLFKDSISSNALIDMISSSNQCRYDNLRYEKKDGSVKDVEIIANLYDENGRSIIQCNIRDITERRRSEEHVKLLMAEVNHRAKNLLAVVQAVAYQTAKRGDAATLADRLSDRIRGLAAGQDLLVKSEWQGVEVFDLVSAQLNHFKELIGTRVLFDGPPARLRPEAAQGIGMALHELATNAVKHGALSNSAGRVTIAWRISQNGKPVFSMSWLEDGGPTVTAPTHKGFGDIVIGRMVEAAVQGTTNISYAEGGFSWRLSAAFEDVIAR